MHCDAVLAADNRYETMPGFARPPGAVRLLAGVRGLAASL